MQYAILGGDMRFVYLAEMLADEGNSVKTVGLENAEMHPCTERVKTVQEAVNNADVILLPYPMVKSEGFLHAPLSREIFTIREVLEELPTCVPILMGCPGEETEKLCRQKCLNVTDYGQREEYLVQNAYITAESAIKVLLEELPVTLQGRNVLIAGYGRIGRALAKMLKALNAEVTVAARRPEVISRIVADGYDSCCMDALEEILPCMEIVINTVPARVFHRKTWDKMRQCRLYLELASRPGGVDITKLTQRGIPAVCARGLPGECAPESAAEALKETVMQIMKEQEKNYG